MKNFPKILLIIPPVTYSRQPSIGVAYISSYLRKNNFEVKVWDLNTDININNDGDDYYWTQWENCRKFYEESKFIFENWIKKIFEYEPDIICFTIWSTSIFFALKLALKIKKIDKNKLIVFGGYWCNVRGMEIFNYPQVDIVVKGEGEETLLEIVKQYAETGSIEFCKGAIIRRNGKILDCGLRTEIEDINLLPYPDFTDFDLEKYVFKYHIPISFSRGCSWRCSFCTVFRSWQKFRVRSAENIYDEILFRLKQYPKLQQFEICDTAFNQDITMLSKLCDLIIENNIKVKFSGMAQIRKEMNLELLKKINKAGFCLCNYGIESGSQQVLDAMGKKYTVEDAQNVIRETYNAGIDVVLNFIVGFPGETEKDFEETLHFIERNKDYISNIAPAHECDIAFTPIYYNPERFNVIIHKMEEHTKLWKTSDYSNDPEVRKNRKKIFDEFVLNLKIPLKCGINDRKEVEKLML